MKGKICKTLQIFIEDADRWEGEPLSEALVRLLRKRKIAGATVLNGVMGYGSAGRIHKKGLFGVTDERPVIIIAIDSDAKLRAVLPEILPMIKEGVLTLSDSEVFIVPGES
jgi:PII-like signaling protein